MRDLDRIAELESRVLSLRKQRDQLAGAVMEASSLFDNYPQLFEMKGTYQRLEQAINAVKLVPGEKTLDPWALTL